MAEPAAQLDQQPAEENRTHKRYDDRPMTLNIGGVSYKTCDWSLGGFQILDFKEHVQVGDYLDCLHISPNGENRGTFKARVAWHGDDNRLGLQLVEINGMPMP